MLHEQAQAVGNLNFAGFAGRGLFQDIENFGRERVSPDDAQVRRRVCKLRLFDDAAKLIHAVVDLIPVDDAVAFDILAGNLFDGDDRSAVLMERIDELLGYRRLTCDHIVREEEDERLIADDVACGKNGIADATLFLLANIRDIR